VAKDQFARCAQRSGFAIGFTIISDCCDREILDRQSLQRRLLLCLYGMGTNTGLKRVSGNRHGISYKELLHVRRRYVHKAALRNAIGQVANAIFSIRNADVWGEGSTSCASDSKKFGSWDQNLMTEWHIRYGGRGVMIYWHVEKEIDLHLFSFEALLFLGSCRHDRGCLAALYRHDDRSAVC